jgi:cleavage and polyadenylation specificity factor subunit 1
MAHPEPTAQLALVTDTSTSAMGAVLQQRVYSAWQPLVFFYKKLNPAQQKYSAYNRELLVVYEAVKHFRHILEARHFIIFTDHKPITYAFQQKRDKCSPRQFNHLDFIVQFTTDIRHTSGKENVVADALSRVESVTAPPSHDALAASQDGDNELRTPPSGSRGNKFPAPRSPSTATHLPGSLGRKFLLPYGSKCSSPSTMSHPGTKATKKLVAQRFVLPGMQKDCRTWTRVYQACQRSKVSHHTVTPLGDSFTSISTSWGLFQRQHTASL